MSYDCIYFRIAVTKNWKHKSRVFIFVLESNLSGRLAPSIISSLSSHSPVLLSGAQSSSLFQPQQDPLPIKLYRVEKEMATHSSILAWEIPWTEEPGGLQSMRSLRVGTTEQLHFHFSLSCIGEGKANPLQCSCLENPRDRGAW